MSTSVKFGEVAPEDYDTDTISLTSTVVDEGGEYPAEGVLAEAEFDDGPRYLIKWQGYGMHACTWEPLANAESILDAMWESKKESYTSEQLTKYMTDNVEQFEAAFHAAELAKKRRQEKREKKRNRQKLQAIPAGRVQSDSDDDYTPILSRRKVSRVVESGNDLSLAVRRRSTRVATGRADNIPSKNRRRSSDASKDSDDDHPIFVRRNSIRATKDSGAQADSYQARKTKTVDPPSTLFVSDESLMQELFIGSKKTKKPIVSKATSGADTTSRPPASKQSISSEIRAKQKSDKPPTVETPTSTTVRKKDKKSVVSAEKTMSGQVRQEKSGTNIIGGSKSSTTLTNSPDIANSCPIAQSAAFLSHSTDNPVISNESSIAQPSGPSSTRTSINKSIPRSTADAAANTTKMVNKPVTDARRQWQNGERHYGKVSMRRNAELRGRNEPAPDTNVLQFVNGAPSELRVQSVQEKSNDAGYSRREYESRHDRDVDVERHTDEEPDTPETCKAPLTCWEWRNGSCQRTAEQCRFHHKDGYKLSPIDGKMPPKHFTKPLVCYYWMTSLVGCSKSADECSYAHYNTGLLAVVEKGRFIESRPIDKSQRPRFEETSRKQPYHMNVPRRNKKELTCYYWYNNNGCRKTEAECAFAHKYTGEVAYGPKGSTQLSLDTNLSSAKAPRIIDTSSEVASGVSPPIFNGPEWGAAPPPPPPPPQERREHGTDASTMQSDAESVDPRELPNGQQASKLSCGEMKNMIEDACNINFETMFAPFRGREEAVSRRAFLVFHPEYHAEEMELMTRWLLMHHVEVGGLWSSGSWDHFRQKIREGGSGVIITHPEFDKFWQIPGFFEILRGYVRLWSVGFQLPAECDLQTSLVMLPPQQDFIEIFPRGGIIYITDEVFEQKPIEAFRIIQAFVRQVDVCRSVLGPGDPSKLVHDGCLLWRLAVRPELMQTTYDWCIEHEAEVEAKHPAAQSRIRLYNLLSECNYIEQDQDESEPYILRPDDYWPIISERKIVSDDYYEALKRSQHDANNAQVDLYAATVLDLRRTYRHYFVVHTEPEKVSWKDRWLHLDDILTPEKCIEYLEQPSAKGNRIDFQSWRFTKKPNESKVVASPKGTRAR